MSAVVFLLAVLLIAGAWYLVESTRNRPVRPWLLTGVAVACGSALVGIALSDWPASWLNEFWTEHSIVGGLLSTVLLLGVGLLSFEVRQLHEAEKLSQDMAGTAFAGLVNPLIDVDAALGLMANLHRLPQGWNDPGKPLRWIRSARDQGNDLDGIPISLDWRPPEDLTPIVPLIDHSMRRIVGGARDWASLGSASTDGRAALATFGRWRNELTSLRALAQRLPGTKDEADMFLRTLIILRAELRMAATALEAASGVAYVRPELEALMRRDVPSIDEAAAFIARYAPPSPSTYVEVYASRPDAKKSPKQQSLSAMLDEVKNIGKRARHAVHPDPPEDPVHA